jgi:hypothetical protein
MKSDQMWIRSSKAEPPPFKRQGASSILAGSANVLPSRPIGRTPAFEAGHRGSDPRGAANQSGALIDERRGVESGYFGPPTGCESAYVPHS